MSCGLKVFKFGGSSVKDVEALHYSASLVKKEQQKGFKLVVVVSAMGSETDKLLKLAFSVTKSPKKRELDMLVSTGERVSCALFAMALDDAGVKAISLTGSQCGILTNEVHQHAEILDIKCSRVLLSLEKHDVVLVAGFQGVDPESKEITTLGRGGSDLTAVALADKLRAESCSIFTDVNGLMTLDPQFFPKAETVAKVSWEKAYSLSCLGAKVLHYRASFLALKKKIPLWIVKTRDPEGAKTYVSSECSRDANFITHKKNQSFVDIEVSGEKDHEVFFSELLSFFWTYDEVPSFFRKASLCEVRSVFSFSLSSELVARTKRFLEFYKGALQLNLKEKAGGFFAIHLLYEDSSLESFFEEKVKDLLQTKELIFFEKEEGRVSFGVHLVEHKEFIQRLSSLSFEK